MLTVATAKSLGKNDRKNGLCEEAMDDIAESISENFGGAAGIRLAAAYREGAGI